MITTTVIDVIYICITVVYLFYSNMKKVEREALAARVIQFYNVVGGHNKKLTIKHFCEEGFQRQVKPFGGIIKRYEEFGTVKNKCQSGRLAKQSCKKVVKRVQKLFCGNSSLFTRTTLQLFF